MNQAHRRIARATAFASVFLALLVAVVASGRANTSARSLPTPAPVPAGAFQDSARPPQDIHIVARRYGFSPQRIEVQENDLVKVTMETADIPHSFTIDDDNYRIAKRATAGHPAVFEFRADKAGSFPFYCNLTTDPGCKNMRGELVVKPKR
jgi:plastocyanin